MRVSRPGNFPRLGVLLLPAALLYAVLLLLPLVSIIRLSFAGGAEHYAALLNGRLLWRAAGNTAAISLASTAVAVTLGYLLAACLWRSRQVMRSVVLGFIMLPFWTAVLVKNFAWAALLQDNGAFNAVLQAVGLTAGPVTLLHNRLAVVIGMVHYVLPYAVFPIYTTMRSIDQRLEWAAQSLGAGRFGVFWTVVLPLTVPGLAASGLLVFIVSAGFFITPVILGAPSDMMLSNLVDYYVHERVDFGAAAALAVLILLAAVPLVAVQQIAARRGQHGLA